MFKVLPIFLAALLLSHLAVAASSMSGVYRLVGCAGEDERGISQFLEQARKFDIEVDADKNGIDIFASIEAPKGFGFDNSLIRQKLSYNAQDQFLDWRVGTTKIDMIGGSGSHFFTGEFRHDGQMFLWVEKSNLISHNSGATSTGSNGKAGTEIEFLGSVTIVMNKNILSISVIANPQSFYTNTVCSLIKMN